MYARVNLSNPDLHFCRGSFGNGCWARNIEIVASPERLLPATDRISQPFTPAAIFDLR